MNTKLHAVTDADGRPIRFFMRAGSVSVTRAKPCIPGWKSRGKPIKHDKRRYKRRNRIEIMFGTLKDWRWVATRYDRCTKVFFSAVASVP